MHRGRSLRLLLAAVLISGLLPLTAVARLAAPRATIEPLLLARLATGGQADFIVQMSARADLSAAAEMDWQDRGVYVWQALNEVARAMQAPVLRVARERGLGAVSGTAGNAVLIRGGDLASAHALADLPGVAGLWLDRVYFLPEDALPAEPQEAAVQGMVTWNVADTKADQVWGLGVRGEGIRVAEIDSGVQWDHPALIDNYGCRQDPGNSACWFDPSGECTTPCDPEGRGTHIMGIMAAKDDPSFPYSAGMAPDATWIACKGCSNGGCDTADLIACADWVLAPGGDPDNRPHVVNSSWGTLGGDPWFLPSVEAWRASGILPVFGVGANGPGCATLISPADYQESLAPAVHDSSRAITSFSARGPSLFGDDPYTKPNISGPGVNICSTYPPDGWSCGYSGSSFSAPHAAGAVALAWSGCPDLIGQMEATFELLQNNADVPPAGNCGAPPDGEGNYTYGYGYLNVLAAVESCLPEGEVHLNRMRLSWRTARPPYYKVIALVRIHDESHVPAAGVTVYAEWTYPDGSVHPQTGIEPTDLLGRARFRAKEPQAGAYQLCVTEMSKAGFIYDPAANEDSACKSIAVGP